MGEMVTGDMMTNENLPRSTSVLDAPATEINAAFASPWIRLAAQLLAGSLDTKLAAGQHPASSHLLAARAQQLASPQYRRGLSDSWLNLLVEVRRPRSAFDPGVPLVRSRVLAAEGQIHALAGALISPLPAVRGLAMAIEILRDGSGPLFNPICPESLTSAIEEIIAQLDPLTSVAGL
jgi:hypothetical protein